jgi:hypothetical protein
MRLRLEGSLVCLALALAAYFSPQNIGRIMATA